MQNLELAYTEGCRKMLEEPSSFSIELCGRQTTRQCSPAGSPRSTWDGTFAPSRHSPKIRSLVTQFQLLKSSIHVIATDLGLQSTTQYGGHQDQHPNRKIRPQLARRRLTSSPPKL
jgi:hypothetical protein